MGTASQVLKTHLTAADVTWWKPDTEAHKINGVVEENDKQACDTAAVGPGDNMTAFLGGDVEGAREGLTARWCRAGRAQGAPGIRELGQLWGCPQQEAHGWGRVWSWQLWPHVPEVWA